MPENKNSHFMTQLMKSKSHDILHALRNSSEELMKVNMAHGIVSDLHRSMHASVSQQWQPLLRLVGSCACSLSLTAFTLV